MERTAAWRPGWPGFGMRGALVLPLDAMAFSTLPESLQVDGIALARKSEYHVTLLDRAATARVHAPAPGGALAEDLPKLFAAQDWGWRLTGERWLLHEAQPEGPAHSVVGLLDMPAFARFRKQIGELLGAALPDAPAHVTLYVAGNPIGIGVDSQAAFERLRVRKIEK